MHTACCSLGWRSFSSFARRFLIHLRDAGGAHVKRCTFFRYQPSTRQTHTRFSCHRFHPSNCLTPSWPCNPILVSDVFRLLEAPMLKGVHVPCLPPSTSAGGAHAFHPYAFNPFSETQLASAFRFRYITCFDLPMFKFVHHPPTSAILCWRHMSFPLHRILSLCPQ